jgi:hypothetical protein
MGTLIVTLVLLWYKVSMLRLSKHFILNFFRVISCVVALVKGVVLVQGVKKPFLPEQITACRYVSLSQLSLSLSSLRKAGKASQTDRRGRGGAILDYSKKIVHKLRFVHNEKHSSATYC